MERISVRQLLREPKKYLVAGEFILTRHGKDLFKVVVSFPGTAPPKPEISDGKCSVEGCSFDVYNDGKCMRHWRQQW